MRDWKRLTKTANTEVRVLTVKSANDLASEMREISVAEFFEKNRQILGFDSPQKALVVCVKEALDNSLDACEEACILPEILIEISKLEDDVYRVVVEDNGPGIPLKNVPYVFGKLLYGSKFHRLRQSRGQQGIGISAAVLYAQITTGTPTTVITKTAEDYTAYKTTLRIDTRRNEPEVLSMEPIIWNRENGVRVELVVKGKYIRGRQSIYEYVQNTAIVNPHARITLIEADGRKTIFERAVHTPPEPPREIRPHPLGIEVGEVLAIARETRCSTVENFLSREFSRISSIKAREICNEAGIAPEKNPRELTLDDVKRLVEIFRKTKFMAPDTRCLSPIGEKLIKKGLKNVLETYRPSFYSKPITREAKVYAGNPFIVEVGMVYGGDLPKDAPVRILRYANKIPLLYKEGSCAITRAVESVDWRRYGLEQKGGRGIPIGPAIILVHVASTRIPYTSEAKEAIAEIPEIINEIRLALQECGRELRAHIIKNKKREVMSEKFRLAQKVIPELSRKTAHILQRPVPDIQKVIAKIMNIIWINEDIERVVGLTRVKTKIVNYTATPQNFKLYAEIPCGKIEKIYPEGNIEDDDIISWQLEIKEFSEVECEIVLSRAENYSETKYYVEGVDPAIVVGAEPPPGDWDIEKLEIIEEFVEDGESLE